MLNENLEVELYNFFLWFRYNGEKYEDCSIEKMINIYIKEKTKQNESKDKQS